MPISERLLRRWRKEALRPLGTEFYVDPEFNTQLGELVLMYHSARERILAMTQELLDQHLLRK